MKKKVFILTGAIQSGKTTSLMDWAKGKNDVFGILTPVIDGKRMFMDMHSRDLFAMEAIEGEKEVLPVGRFAFSAANFTKARRIIRDAMGEEGWLVIDEIGPLELKGQGFYEVVKEITSFQLEKQNLVLVVRAGLAEDVAKLFGLSHAVIIPDVSSLEDKITSPVTV